MYSFSTAKHQRKCTSVFLTMRTLVLLLIFGLVPVLAQQCYYPDGTPTDDIPCQQNGDGACCPDKWQCIGNGLCYYTVQNYYGRYTCTDKSWSAPGCPNQCTDHAQSGDEAIAQCDDGSFCCDFNRDPTKNCCNDLKREVAEVQAVHSVVPSSSKPSSTAQSSKESSSSASPSASTPTQSSQSTVVVGQPLHTSGSSTLTTSDTNTQASSSVSTSSSSTKSIAPIAQSAPPPKKNLGTILGLAMGIPVALVAIGAMLWLLYRRRKRGSNNRRQATPYDFSKAHSVAEKPSPKNGGDCFIADDKPASVNAPSEIDSREVRIPINQPRDTAHLSPDSANFSRETTAVTLYPNARYDYPTSPNLPQSPTVSTIVSNAGDYSEWSPTVGQNRWSDAAPRAADRGDLGVGSDSGAGGAGAGTTNGQQRPISELMGRPRIPSTIAELPG